MGCWNETCAITKKPILEGKSVFMIVPKEYAPHANMSWESYYNSLQSLHYGTYDGYGWIKEVELKQYCKENNDKRPDLKTIFVLKPVMDMILSIVPPKDPVFHDYKPIQYLDHLLSLTQFAWDSRIDLTSGLLFKGSQHQPSYYQDLISMMKENYEMD